jgi:hypothetical protein
VYRGQFCVARYHRTPPKVGIIGEAIRNMQAKKCLPQQKKKCLSTNTHSFVPSFRSLVSRKGKTVFAIKSSDKKAFLFLCVLIFMLYPFCDKNLRKWNSAISIKHFSFSLSTRIMLAQLLILAHDKGKCMWVFYVNF